MSREAVQENLGERYEVGELLGHGGMGVVYKVRDKTLDKTFAIKVLNRSLVQDVNSVKRFEQEAHAASNLTHANLVAVYEYGMGTKGAPFIIMDYLDGCTIAESLHQEGFFDGPRALDVFIQVAEALVHAHMKGVIHRDIKPGNIILTKADNAPEMAKLVDFGIAKVLPTHEQAAKLTQTGEIFGSPLYMSPEQCLGNKLDARSDIYAFGCVMYESLTNVAPFAADNPIKTILKQVNDEATPFDKLPGSYSIANDLQLVIFRCLEKDPADRYQSAQDLLADLTRIRDGKPISSETRRRKNKQQKPGTGGAYFSNPRKLFSLAVIAASIVGLVLVASPWLSSNFAPPSAGPKLTGNPHEDADELDRWSFIYYTRGDYERAIPLLEFGLKTYKEGGKHYNNSAQETVYLGDNYNHLGKCYLALNQPEKAVSNYKEALRLYNKSGDYPGSNFGEAVKDYAAVLRKLGREPAADKMLKQFRETKRVADIP